MDTRLEIRRALERGRSATEDLLAPVSDETLAAQLAPGVPPLVWSYAHVARFEELWILRTIGGARPIPDVHDHVYDAFRRERSNGAKLPTLSPNAVRAYAERRPRARRWTSLERVDLEAPGRARPPRVRVRARAPERAAVAGGDARDAAVPDRAPSTR